MIRPSWENIAKMFYGSYVGCSCGQTLQTQEQLRNHWQLGHFDFIEKNVNDGWIDVKYQLPEEDGRYLVSHRLFAGKNDSIEEIMYFHKETGEFGSEKLGDWSMPTVTHWKFIGKPMK